MSGNQKRQCTVPGCGRQHFSRGYCRAHKARWDRNGEVFPEIPIEPPPSKDAKLCSVDGCDEVAHSRGMCAYHYQAVFRAGVRAHGQADPCSVDGCDKPVRSRSLCSTHYARMRLHGTTDLLDRAVKPKRIPPAKPRKSPQGYVYARRTGHPNANKNGWMHEHRAVMSDHIGRPLLPLENVHHINGHRDDNRIENLELWTRSQPSGQRVSDKILWAVEFLQQYAPEALSGYVPHHSDDPETGAA